MGVGTPLFTHCSYFVFATYRIALNIFDGSLLIGLFIAVIQRSRSVYILAFSSSTPSRPTW
jgi:hypothetical protein